MVGEVTVGGEVRQPLHVVAESLTILPSANLLAPVTYRGPVEARVQQGAKLAVPLSYTRVPARDAHRARPSVGSAVLFTLHASIAGLLFFWLVPRLSSGAAATLRAEPGRSMLAGFVLLVTVPAAALLLVVSVHRVTGRHGARRAVPCSAAPRTPHDRLRARRAGVTANEATPGGRAVAASDCAPGRCVDIGRAAISAFRWSLDPVSGRAFGLGSLALWIPRLDGTYTARTDCVLRGR